MFVHLEFLQVRSKLLINSILLTSNQHLDIFLYIRPKKHTGFSHGKKEKKKVQNGQL
jgi:hypothetical protein